MAVKPSEVFTPAGAVSPGMFAARAHDAVERTLTDTLEEPGQHIALHGWTGVGKTSLLDHVCRTRGIEYLKVECGGSFESIMHEVLSDLDQRFSKEITEKRQGDSELRGGAGQWFGGKVRRGSSSQESFGRYGASLDKVVVDALVEAGIQVLFLDNLEDLDDEQTDRQAVGLLMKKCSRRSEDLGPAAPKVVLAGPTAAVEALLLDKTVARRTTRVPVPRMRREEMEEILLRGAEMLEMTFDDDCREEIVAHAYGLPYYVHLFALYSCRAAIRAEREEVTLADFHSALDQIIGPREPVLAPAYWQATQDCDRPSVIREMVLETVAGDNQEKVSHGAVHEDLLSLLPADERVDSGRFIGRSLEEFRDEFGILEDVWMDDGSPAYRFRDPMMRVYVRLRALRKRRAAHADWISSLALYDGFVSRQLSGDSGMRVFARAASVSLPLGKRAWQGFLRRHGLEQIEYDDINRMGEDLAAETAALAYVPAGAFLHLRDHPYEPVASALAVPGNAPELSGLLVVSVLSEVTEFGQLRGKRLASTGRFSTTSYVGPALLLHEQGESIHNFFETVEGFAVGGEVEALLRDYADVAMVEERAWNLDPSNRERTRVIARRDRLPAPVLIAAAAVDQEVKAELTEIVLGHRNQPAFADGFSGFAPCRREDLEEFFAEADAALTRP